MLVGRKSRGPCREFPGPTPHSVAVLARQPSCRPPDYHILERKKREATRNNVLEFTKDQRACEVRTLWERSTQKRIVSATIDRHVCEAMEQHMKSIDERRERLRKMLESEERELLQEMEAKEDTMLERQTRMRERAKYLQEKRERERQKVAAEKLDQLFREQSEELRSSNIRRHQEEVCTERAAQIQMRQEEHRLQQEEEMLFAQLWEGDRLAKEQRENLRAQRRKENNLEQLAFLRTQMEAAEQQRLQAKQLKEEEAQLLRDQREMIHLEEEWKHRQKLQNQETWRKQLDTSLRLKMKRLAREQQEELALDMSILEQLLTLGKDEKKQEALRKLELREEQQRYRQYLAEQLEEQRQHEAELEKLFDAELQQKLKHRAEQNRLAKEARDRLMKDVLDIRRLQIQENLEKNAKKQAELAKERDELNTIIQMNKLLDEQEKKRLREVCQEYQANLLAQILHSQQMHDIKQAENDREVQRSRMDEEKYNQKVQEIMSRPTSHTTAVHPFRRRKDQPTTN